MNIVLELERERKKRGKNGSGKSPAAARTRSLVVVAHHAGNKQAFLLLFSLLSSFLLLLSLPLSPALSALLFTLARLASSLQTETHSLLSIHSFFFLVFMCFTCLCACVRVCVCVFFLFIFFLFSFLLAQIVFKRPRHSGAYLDLLALKVRRKNELREGGGWTSRKMDDSYDRHKNRKIS